MRQRLSCPRPSDDFLAADDLVVVQLTADVVDLATAVRTEHWLKTPDSLQAASALAPGAATVFITNDPCFERVAGLDVRLL